MEMEPQVIELTLSKVYLLYTDTIHIPDQPDINIINLIKEADLVIYDSMFTEEEFKDRPHWVTQLGRKV